jgi:hypothetical protein
MTPKHTPKAVILACENPALVAAAPDLLAALQGCAAALTEAGKDFALASPLAVRPNLYELHAATAHAVIAQAQGNEVKS